MSETATVRYDSLNRTNREILRLIAEHEPIEGPDLVERSKRHQPAVSGSTQDLRDAGLVVNRSDGRTHEYALTGRGRNILLEHVSEIANAAGYRVVANGGTAVIGGDSLQEGRR